MAGEPFLQVDELNLVADKGIREDKRYFGRPGRDGKPFKRQVTLIEREMIQTHADALGADFSPGDVRSNIETAGIDLIALMGHDVQVGEAVLRFVEPRTPCKQMDALAPGLRELMEDGRQGVIAMVMQSGRVRADDCVAIISAAPCGTPRETNS